jgi:hypothetical protein
MTRARLLPVIQHLAGIGLRLRPAEREDDGGWECRTCGARGEFALERFRLLICCPRCEAEGRAGEDHASAGRVGRASRPQEKSAAARGRGQGKEKEAP